MLPLIKQHKIFFLLTFFYIVAGAWIITTVPKGKLELFINYHHHPWLDTLFQLVTHLGDGLVSVIFLVLIFFRNRYLGLVSTLCFIVTTIITQGLKRLVFEDIVRPRKFFEGTKDLYYIDGLDIHSNFSFPSGHTSGAFTVFFFLAFITRRNFTDLIFFALSFLVSLSRIYLMQHFFIDTYFGALIGIVFTFLIYCYFEMFTNLKNHPKFNRPLLS